MYNYIDYSESIKKRINYYIKTDIKKQGYIYCDIKKKWVVYSFNKCKEMLNSNYFSKKKLTLPLNFFPKSSEDELMLFQNLISSSNIFLDRKSDNIKQTLSLLSHKINLYDIANSHIKKLSITKNEITNNFVFDYNNNIINSVFYMNKQLHAEAINVGKLFDGKINNKEEFLSIVKDYLLIYNYFDLNKKQYLNISTENLCLTFIASHYTTAQLINAVFFSVKSFNIKNHSQNLMGVIYETSRIFSPVTVISRIANNNIINSKYFDIQKYDDVFFDINAINFDSMNFIHPFLFNHQRKISNLSFGHSKSRCPGVRLSLDAVKVFTDLFFKTFIIEKINVKSIDIGKYSFGLNEMNMKLEYK